MHHPRGIEFDAANTIYNFMQTHTNDYGTLPLVGFNSARFDFKHFEKLLLKHGLNPTFYGKISSLDIYQYAKYCALHNIDTFPFTQKKQQDTNSFSFKLEDLAKAFDCLHTPQTHDAKDDVLLTIELTKQLESNFPTSLKAFHALQHNTNPFLDPNVILKEPTFPSSKPPPPHWLTITNGSSLGKPVKQLLSCWISMPTDPTQRNIFRLR